MKKILSAILVISLILSTQAVFANAESEFTEVEYLPDGSCYVTIIEDVPASGIQLFAVAKTETKSKTTYYKNAAGDIMWWVKVTGTFTYGNGTSKCTSAKGTAAAEHKMWKVSNISDSKSGNSASAKATGKQYFDGSVSQTLTKTVTLKCSPTGVFS